jgi:hypothetical protein
MKLIVVLMRSLTTRNAATSQNHDPSDFYWVALQLRSFTLDL